MTPVELLSLLQECLTEAAKNPTSINPACPALAPPPGELPLDPNAATLWYPAVGILAACCALVCLSMALRIFTRTFIVKRRFALEDSKNEFVSIHQKRKADTSPALMVFAAVGLRHFTLPLTYLKALSRSCTFPSSVYNSMHITTTAAPNTNGT